MATKSVAIIYNAPDTGGYQAVAEEKAELGVLDELEAVDKALNELGYLVDKIPLLPPMEQVGASLGNLHADVVFNLFEGFAGRPETEAMVANLLSELGLRYTGCPGEAIALALDKASAKALLKSSGIATPQYQLLSPRNVSDFFLPFPCIVKPAREHASHSLSADSVVNDLSMLEKQVVRVSQSFGGQALVEEFIDGREFNATVLSNMELTVMPVAEVIYSLPPTMPRLLTFEAKWQPESVYFQNTQVSCPAKLGRRESDKINATARKVFEIFGCRGYARVDMRQNGTGKLHVLEVNPNPDISPEYGAARQAAAAGMNYNQFIDKIVKLALSGKQK